MAPSSGTCACWPGRGQWFNEGRICWTNCGFFSHTQAALVLPIHKFEGIFKFISVNSTSSCPTTMLALTSPSKYSKMVSVWTDEERMACGTTWAGAAASVTKAFKSGSLHNKISLNWQKYVPFTERKRPDSGLSKTKQTLLLQSMANVVNR